MNDEQVKWEKDKHRYSLVGGPAGSRTLVDRLYDLLPTNPDEAVDADALTSKYSAAHGRITARTVENELSKLKKKPSVVQVEGTGVKGKPGRLYRKET
jgi:hypothetical protein